MQQLVIRLCLSIVALSAVVAHALAKDSAKWAPQPLAGMMIEFMHTDGTLAKHRITKVEGNNVWNTVDFDNGGVPAKNVNITYRSIITWQIYRPAEGVIRWEFDRKKLDTLWPLQVGKSVRVKTKLMLGRGKTLEAAAAKLKQTHSITYRFVVEGRRHVTVKGGTWQAWVISRVAEQRDMKGTLTYVGMRRYWLAERLGWIVRLDTDDIRPDEKKNRITTMQATAVALPARKKN